MRKDMVSEVFSLKYDYCGKWKKWEIALALSLTITFSCAGGVPAYWWGVIFPQLAGAEYAWTETSGNAGAAGEGAFELRFRLLEWAQELWETLNVRRAP